MKQEHSIFRWFSQWKNATMLGLLLAILYSIASYAVIGMKQGRHDELSDLAEAKWDQEMMDHDKRFKEALDKRSEVSDEMRKTLGVLGYRSHPDYEAADQAMKRIFQLGEYFITASVLLFIVNITKVGICFCIKGKRYFGE